MANSKKNATPASAPFNYQQLSSIRSLLITSAAGLITIIGLRYIARDLVAPLLMALFLSILMRPLFLFFRKRNFSRGVSLFLMLTTFIIVVLGFGFFISWAFSLISGLLPGSLQSVQTAVADSAAAIGVDPAAASSATASASESLSLFFISLLDSLSNTFFYLLITPVLAILLVLQFDAIPEKTVSNLMNQNPNLSRYKKFADSIIIYVVSRLKVNLLTGALFTIALIIFGIDYALVWGVLTALASFIPYVGLLIAGIPPVLIAFSQGGWVSALLVIISILIINLLAENIFEPYIQGKGSKLSPATVVIALVFWTWVLGAIGAILAVPLTVLLKIILADYRETNWLASFMEGNFEKICLNI